MQKQNITAIIANASIALILLSTDIYLPCIPQMATALSSNIENIQITISFFMFAMFLSGFLAGSFSDWLGRRPVMLFGLLIFSIGSIACIISFDAQTLIVSRVVQGIGAGCIFVTNMAALQDNSTPHQGAKLLSLTGICISIVPIMAPIIGGVLNKLWNWRAIFIFVSLSSLPVLLYTGKHLTNTGKNKEIGPFSWYNEFNTWKKTAANRTFWIYSILYPLLSCGLWVFLTAFPAYWEAKHLNHIQSLGWLLGLLALAYACGAVLSLQLLKTTTLDKILLLGIKISFFGLILALAANFIFPSWPIMIIAPIMLYEVGMALAHPASTTMALRASSSTMGKASAIRGTLGAVSAGIGSLIASFLKPNSLIQPISIMIALTLFCFLLLLLQKGTPSNAPVFSDSPLNSESDDIEIMVK